MANKQGWNLSWLRILRFTLITAALATGAPTLVRDFILLRAGSPTPSEASYWSWLRICAFGSLVVAWLQEHQALRKSEERLKTRLVIPKKIYEQPYGDGNVSYYFDVTNDSEGTTVSGVEVKLTSIRPAVAGLAWLPIPLQLKHDTRAQRTRSFDLNPRDKKQIDLVFGQAGMPGIQITDVIADSKFWTRIPNNRYTFTVEATGKDTPPAWASFEVWRGETGYLRCTVSEDGLTPTEPDALSNGSPQNQEALSDAITNH